MSEELVIVGIGASAGGLEALRQMFGADEDVRGMAFVVVQHLDPTHESLMAQLLERYTSMTVRQVEGGETLAEGQIYVIPPGHGLALEDGVLRLTDFTDPRGMRRPIDDFFESLAEDQGALAACVILSGTGADGSRGLRAVKEHGGLCIAQEPESARYDGMPLSAIGTGLTDYVRQPERILETLATYFERRRDKSHMGEAQSVADHVDELCDALREAVGHDFSGYKHNTLVRRIARRMQVLGIDNARAYLDRIRSDSGECEALFRDLLINVTRFFRDQEVFEALDREVIRPMIERARDQDEVRVWVPGCSSGEEAFTIAMLIAEAARAAGKSIHAQIFATDIDDKMLGIAREATYPLSALGDIPSDLRERYVIGQADTFTLSPRIRDMVRFSNHSLVKDPPFSKIDLVSCRNLLIYFNDQLQQRVIPLFHFALRQDGVLMLGSSEGVGRFDDLFAPVDQKARLFRRRTVTGHYSLPAMAGDTIRSRRPAERGAGRENWVETRALRRLADHYAPVSLLVDAEGNLLQRFGAVGRYLDFPDRLERRVHAPSLAKPGLREVLGAILRDAAGQGRRVLARDVKVITDFGVQPVSVLADPIGEEAVLVVIRQTGNLDPFEGDDIDELDRGDGHLTFLEEELQATRHRLRSTVEELETTNEELKSSNEEMMSMNEELQSTNEELTTVNDELKNKVDQVTIANSDLQNFFDSTEMMAIVVDSELRIRSLTDAAAALLAESGAERGVPLAELDGPVEWGASQQLLKDAARLGRTGETRISTGDGARDYIARAFPYRRLDGSVDGATLVLTDVTDSLSLERELSEERKRLQLALEVAGIGVWEYEPSTDRIYLDETERRLLAISDDDEGDRMEPILERMSPDDRNRVNQSLRRAMNGDQAYDEIFRIFLDDGTVRWLHGLGQRIMIGENPKFIGVTYDITAERELTEQRELLLREMNHRVKNLFAVISAMVTISARGADSVETFATDLKNRIQSLGRSHALATRSIDDKAVTLEQLVRATVEPSLGGQAFRTDGEPITLSGKHLTPLALIFHEWATNAAKYGALSRPAGALDVRWSRDEDKVVIDWTEEGADESDGAPDGFGSRLVDATVRQLKGRIDGGANGDRFHRRLTLPLD